MNVDELAAELYDLVVIKGRWKGKGRGDSYYTLPEWTKGDWRDEAKTFAEKYSIFLDVPEPVVERPRYVCNRGSCNGAKVLFADQTTHSQFHDRNHGKEG